MTCRIHAEARFTLNGTRYLAKDFEGGTIGRATEVYNLDAYNGTDSAGLSKFVGYSRDIAGELADMANLSVGRFECETQRRDSDDGICGLVTDNFEASIVPHGGSDGGLDVAVYFNGGELFSGELRFSSVSQVRRYLGELEIRNRGERVEDALCSYNTELATRSAVQLAS